MHHCVEAVLFEYQRKIAGVGDITHPGDLALVFEKHRFDAVMHFASLIQVGESVQRPSDYYRVNLTGTLQLLEAMLAASVRKFIFSSSAAIFGEPQYTPID